MDWIKDSINEAAAQYWAAAHAKFIAFITLSFLDPFYHWFVYGLVIALACFALAWFFGGLFPWLRAACGFIILIITFGLWTFWQGEAQARQYDKPKKKKH